LGNLNTPLYSGIKKYIDSKPVAFHMPGHKLGAGFVEGFKLNLASCDLTEIPGLDNLHYPEDIINEAQEFTAKAYGAANSFFLVNGSTSGILTIIMTVCKQGDSLVVARDCHKSVINAMILAGVNPIYIKPGYNSEFGITTGVTALEVKNTLFNNPEAIGVFLTRPNYYGICSDITGIADIVHKAGKVLIVDEAHGAHLAFSKSLPIDALAGGADICVQSAHKTLPALTQGAFLHVKSDKIDLEKLKTYLSIFQTSSPSYIIMASLDIARATMEDKGEGLLDELLSDVMELKESLGTIKKIKVLAIDKDLYFEQDMTRIVIKLRELGITGFFAEKILRQDYNIQVEMSDLYNIVCIATIADKKESFEKLYGAIADIAFRFKDAEALADIYNMEIMMPRQILSLKQTLQAETKKVKFRDACKMVSAAAITPYPPGIPLICPGEEISEQIHSYIMQILISGAKVNGIGNNEEISVLI
jgi:lysine decarboxylase